jgi:hypothetical protein
MLNSSVVGFVSTDMLISLVVGFVSILLLESALLWVASNLLKLKKKDFKTAFTTALVYVVLTILEIAVINFSLGGVLIWIENGHITLISEQGALMGIGAIINIIVMIYLIKVFYEEVDKNAILTFITILVLEAIVYLILMITLVAVGVSNETYKLPDDFVDNQSVDHSSGSFLIDDVVRYPAKANVTALNLSDRNIKVGVAAQTYELNFGNVPQNITVRKFINLGNGEKGPVRICVKARGNIGPHVYFNPGDNIILSGGEQKDLEVAFNSTRTDLYSGEIDLIVRKPKYGALEYFLFLIRC